MEYAAIFFLYSISVEIFNIRNCWVIHVGRSFDTSDKTCEVSMDSSAIIECICGCGECEMV